MSAREASETLEDERLRRTARPIMNRA